MIFVKSALQKCHKGFGLVLVSSRFISWSEIIPKVSRNSFEQEELIVREVVLLEVAIRSRVLPLLRVGLMTVRCKLLHSIKSRNELCSHLLQYFTFPINFWRVEITYINNIRFSLIIVPAYDHYKIKFSCPVN